MAEMITENVTETFIEALYNSVKHDIPWYCRAVSNLPYTS